jgi:pimeloyl-ACP methyl ester carboxylesterase
VHERTVEVEGLRVKLAYAGSGPPLVLLHGLMGTHAYWRPFARRLASRHTVVLIDLPGHGDSDPLRPFDFVSCARVVADASEAAGITRPIVAGHSLGSAVAVHWAAQREVAGVMPISPIGGAPLEVEVPSWEIPLGRALLAVLPLWEWVASRPGIVRSLIFGSFVAMQRLDDLDPVMARQILRGAVGTAGVVEDLLAPLDGLDLRALARRVQAPALVCWGEMDRLGVSNGPGLAEALHAESVAIPDVGHMPMLESPYALLAAFRTISALSLAA